MQTALNPDAGAEIMLANWVLEEASCPATNSTRLLVADCIRLLAKQGGSVKDAARYILERIHQDRMQGVKINRGWFEDQKYMPDTPQGPTARVPSPDEVRARQEQREAQEREAYATWESMSAEYRAANPWLGRARG